MIEFTLEWINPLPMWIKSRILRFVYYLSCKNILTGYFKLTTPAGISCYNNILSIPRVVYLPDTGESFHVDLTCVQVVWVFTFNKQ